MAEATGRARVLVLGLGWFPDQRSGLDRYVRELVERLDDDVEAVVVGPATDPPAGVHVAARHDAPLPVRLTKFARAAGRAAGRVDVVDAHFALYAALPVLLGRVRRHPLVVHFHGPWAEESVAGGAPCGLGFWARRTLERAVCRRAETVVVLSEEFASRVVRHTGVPRDRVVVVPPGVDGNRFAPGDRGRARARLGIPADAWVAVAARRLVPRTGIDVLVDAWSALADDPEAQLLVAGDGPARRDLEVRAARAGGTVRFLGPVSDSDLVELYRAADVCVVPSRALEGFGLVVLESLACGTPVIVTDVGGLPEAVAGLGVDVVVPAGEVAPLAARMLGARDGSRPLPPRDACRAFAERFSWKAVVEWHRGLYARVACARADRPRVMFVDHTARLSGGEIAMLRTVEALVRTPGGDGAEVEVVLFEAGPLEPRLRAVGAAVETVPLGRVAGELDRSRVRPGKVPLGAVAAAGLQVVRLARLLRRRRPDLVHANSLKAGVIAGLACRIARVPMVWQVRDRVADDYLPAPAVCLLRWFIPWVSSAVVTYPATRDLLILPPSTVAVALADPYRPEAGARSRSQGAAPHPLRIGLVGRIAPWKGQDVFVDAFARAFPDGAETAVIAGAPMFGEDELDRSLREQARGLGIGDRIEFAGFVDDVPGLLSGLDVLVHASVLAEPHGQVVVEGMAAGLAVVATAAGGPAEIVTDDVDGLLVPPGDVDALADALRRLARDPELRARLGKAAVRRAADFDPDRVVPVLRDLYTQVLRRRRRGGR